MVYIVTYDYYMSAKEMQAVCPSAIGLMKCLLKGYRLTFRYGVLSIEKGSEGDAVPAVVWAISESDAEDFAAVYPQDLYTKVHFCLRGEGFEVDALSYLLNESQIALPDEDYMDKIDRAYEELDFDYWYIENAADFAADHRKEDEPHEALHTGADRAGERRES